MTHRQPVQFECANPILSVEDMPRAVKYYVDVLGFENAAWGSNEFTYVTRGSAGIYLCKGEDRHTGCWVWIGVSDGEKLYQDLKARGAKLLDEPANHPWALEFHVEDLDGNILRIGSEPNTDSAEHA